MKEISECLSKDNSCSLHTISFNKQYNTQFIRYKGQQMQADLIDVSNLSENNNDTKFLLAIFAALPKTWGFLIKNKKYDVVFKVSKNLLEILNKFKEVY